MIHHTSQRKHLLAVSVSLKFHGLGSNKFPKIMGELWTPLNISCCTCMYCFPGNSWTTERERVSQTRSVLSWLDWRTHVSFGIHTISVGCAHTHTHTHTIKEKEREMCTVHMNTHTITKKWWQWCQEVFKRYTQPTQWVLHPHTFIYHTQMVYILTPSSTTSTVGLLVWKGRYTTRLQLQAETSTCMYA